MKIQARLALPFAVPALACTCLTFACGNSPEAKPPQPAPLSPPAVATAAPPAKAASAKVLDDVPRVEWNRLAAELALPLFWSSDANGNGALDPAELAVTWGLDRSAKRSDYVTAAGFTAKARAAHEAIRARHAGGAKDPPGLAADEVARREAVRKELAQGRATLVSTDLSKATPEEKRFVAALEEIAVAIEDLYAKQEGTFSLRAKVPADDPASRALFFRAQGPKCNAPLTEKDPHCNAVPNGPTGKLSGLYPAAMLAEPGFCAALTKKDKALMSPFVVVRGDASAPKAVPYNEVYKSGMTAIATKLDAAAKGLGEKEPALQAYLRAAAQSFRDDKWWPADEAWAKMNAKNSKFYLRLGPDEVYDEPCSTKALFHVSFGLINQGSLKWQEKLDPLKGEMEHALAAMAGAPYKARKVSFSLPDFVDIVLNAGDSRKEFGATIGQSLPNFGPVANEGRGRTVAMTNFYTDPDSLAQAKENAESLLCKSAMAKYTSSQDPQLMSVVLHEAAHNLGPAHQYKVKGKIDREVFGGPLASTLEELKAQTAALYFTDWLVSKSQITREQADQAHVRDLLWSFGHISRGMYTEDHHPRNYSQLAAIQLGWLMKNGAVAWKASETAANGKDKGCFEVSLGKFPAAVKSLMVEVAQIKGKGSKARAEKLLKDYVDVTGDKKKVLDVITERLLRSPKASFVYEVKLN